MANVLLVDDSLVARRLLRNVLERDSRILIVGEAGDPDEAVRLAQRLRPSLITMDLHLPRRDGIAVTGEITPGNSTAFLKGTRISASSGIGRRSGAFGPGTGRLPAGLSPSSA